MGPRDRKRVVLVVDDDEDIRTVIAEVLQLAGYTAITAKDGEEALTLMRSHPELCVVLLDMMMPGVDGWEFRRHQLGDPALARVPVVVLSGAGSAADIAREIAADDFLSKPVLRDHLVEMVSRYCPPD
jgi:CheY-like chemotaxis protein